METFAAGGVQDGVGAVSDVVSPLGRAGARVLKNNQALARWTIVGCLPRFRAKRAQRNWRISGISARARREKPEKK